MQKVYAHEVLYCRYESSWTVKTIHATKAGAWQALRRDLVAQYNKAREDWFLYGRSIYERGGGAWQYQSYEQQRVKEYTVNATTFPPVQSAIKRDGQVKG